MVNDIIRGIARAVHAACPGQEIHRHSVEQGLTEPCFFLQHIDSTVSRLGKHRWLYANSFDVIWFPEDGGDNAAMDDMAACLAQALEFITVPDGGKLLGTGIRWEIEDGALHFFISFSHTARREPADGELLEGAVLETTLRKGE